MMRSYIIVERGIGERENGGFCVWSMDGCIAENRSCIRVVHSCGSHEECFWG